MMSAPKLFAVSILTWRRALGLAVVVLGAVTSAQAGTIKDAGSGCAVVAQGYLASNDYLFQYQGACKNGLAEGKGRAAWTLRHAPSKQVVWEGRFSGGVYLPAPDAGLSAREWGRDAALFDLGPLPALDGLPATRLKVDARGDLTDHPDPCQPRTLWVVNAPMAAMAEERNAEALLRSAVDKLKARCGSELGRKGDPTRSESQRQRLSVRSVFTPDLETDRFGNPISVVAEAHVSTVAGEALQHYTNSAALQQRQQQAKQQRQGEQEGNQRRLRGFFQQHQAQGWASLSDIAQNPFRYEGRVVVTQVQLEEVLSAKQATVSARDTGHRYGSVYAVLDGEGLAQWKPGARLLAVRVQGRRGEQPFKDAAQLQLVAAQACAEADCGDWLRLPTPLSDGQIP